MMNLFLLLTSSAVVANGNFLDHEPIKREDQQVNLAEVESDSDECTKPESQDDLPGYEVNKMDFAKLPDTATSASEQVAACVEGLQGTLVVYCENKKYHVAELIFCTRGSDSEPGGLDCNLDETTCSETPGCELRDPFTYCSPIDDDDGSCIDEVPDADGLCPKGCTPRKQTDCENSERLKCERDMEDQVSEHSTGLCVWDPESGKYVWECTENYSGPTCATSHGCTVQEAAQCKNGAACTKEADKNRMCECPPGFTGDTCESCSQREAGDNHCKSAAANHCTKEQSGAITCGECSDNFEKIQGECIGLCEFSKEPPNFMMVSTNSAVLARFRFKLTSRTTNCRIELTIPNNQIAKFLLAPGSRSVATLINPANNTFNDKVKMSAKKLEIGEVNNDFGSKFGKYVINNKKFWGIHYTSRDYRPVLDPICTPVSGTNTIQMTGRLETTTPFDKCIEYYQKEGINEEYLTCLTCGANSNLMSNNSTLFRFNMTDVDFDTEHKVLCTIPGWAKYELTFISACFCNQNVR